MFKRFFLLLPCILLLSGCSSGTDYWQNRLDDLADCAAFTVGTGWGLKVQASALQIDSMYNYAPRAGFQGGEFFTAPGKHNDLYHAGEGNIGAPLFFANSEIFYPGLEAAKRGKAYSAMTPLLPILVTNGEIYRAGCNSCGFRTKMAVQKAAQAKINEAKKQGIELENSGNTFDSCLSAGEKEAIYNDPELGGKSRLETFGRRNWSIYSDFNVVVAPVFGFRLGFNPGELLDFLLGWGCIDIYADDL